MQRTHSLTSVSSSASSARHKQTDSQRQDLSTESLLSESSIFQKKPRKPDSFSGRSLQFSFPNGEVFTPRTAPTKRHRPPRMHPPSGNAPNYPPAGAPHNQAMVQGLPRIPRSASMVLVPTASLNAALNGQFSHTPVHNNGQKLGPAFGDSLGPHVPQNLHSSAGSIHLIGAPLAHAGSYMTRSHSFNNLRIKSKQELVNSLRNPNVDTPTNIKVQPPPPALPQNPANQYVPAQGRLFSLTNNRYADNATNIVRLELMLASAFPGHGPGPGHMHSQSLGGGPSRTPLGPDMAQVDRPPSLESTPSIISTYNLNRSNSNTPQTSVSGSDTTPENAPHLWDSAESVSSFRTARDPSPLASIEESIGSNATPEPDTAKSVHCDLLPFPSPSPSVSGNLEFDHLDRSRESGISSTRSGTKAETPIHSISTITPEDSFSVEQTGNGLVLGKSPAEPAASNDTTREVLSPAVSNISSEVTLGAVLALLGSSEEKKVAVPSSASSALDNATIHEQDVDTQNSTKDPVEISEVLLGKPLDVGIPKQTPEPAVKSHASSSSEEKGVKLSDHLDTLAEDLTVRTDEIEVTSPGSLTEDIPTTNSLQAPAASKDSSAENEKEVNSPSAQSLDSSEVSVFAANDRMRVPPKLSLLERRRPGVSPILISSSSFDLRDSPLGARTLTIYESARAAKLESDLRYLINTLEGKDGIPMRRDLIDESNIHGPPETIMQSLSRSGSQRSTLIRTYSQDNLNVGDGGLYTPDHIDRFLADDQEAVPPRGDVAVKDGSINFHKRKPSSIASIQSPQLKGSLAGFSPREPHSPYGSSLRGSRSMETLNSHIKVDPAPAPVPAPKRSSMLAIVDVDFDAPVPHTPKRDFFSASTPDEAKLEATGAEKEKTPEKNALLQRSASVKTMSSKDPSAKGFRKIFKFLKFGSKNSKELKSLKSSLRASASSADLSKELPKEPLKRRLSLSLRSVKTQDRSPELPAKKHSGTKKKEFLSNLKLTTGFKVYDLPSPYTARELTDLPDRRSFIEDSDKLRVDLPHYDVEDDTFGDVLLKFKEVEEEIEREVRVVRKTKSIHDYFLRDDELSKAQISDLQKKDQNISSCESLPGKSSNPDENNTSFDSADGEFGTPSQEMLSEKIGVHLVDFPQNSDSRTVVMDMEHVMAALSLSDPKITRKSYLKFVRQLTDFKEVKIELTGFDPIKKTEVEAGTEQKAPIINRKSAKEPKSVKFSNSISISETYDPGWYKRNNRSVTQYYIKEFSEINRIKNELNAYKCYEMLVHEKSQTNTHFFY